MCLIAFICALLWQGEKMDLWMVVWTGLAMAETAGAWRKA